MTPVETIALFLAIAIAIVLVATSPVWGPKWPLVSRHRLEAAQQELGFRDTRERCHENRERDLETVIEQNAEVQESQRTHIKDLQVQLEHVDGEYLASREQLQAERDRNEQLRKEFAGDLQLERQRYDDFVRDMIEKVIAPPPATAPRARSSSPERALPQVILSAIEDAADGSAPMEQHLEREAWRRLKSDNSNAAEIAEAIRKGETPE